MNIDEQELQEWVKSLRNTITSSGFGKISEEGIFWIICEYGKLLKNKPSDLEIVQKALSGGCASICEDGRWFVEKNYDGDTIAKGQGVQSLLAWAKQTIGEIL